jgi:capsular polysaccharide biosynthesis protein
MDVLAHFGILRPKGRGIDPQAIKVKSVLRFLRQFFYCNIQTSAIFKNKSKRIYISRADASYRKIVNELKVIEFLEKYGFSLVQLGNLSFLDQVKLFRDVEIVIAFHGTGLSNLVFSPGGAKVIEIFASPDFVVPCYWVLIQHIGLDYYYLIRESKECKDSGVNYRRCNTINFEFDLTKRRKTFDLGSITL